MTLPAAGYISTAGRTTAEQQTALEDVRNVIAGLLGGQAEGTVALASDAFVPGAEDSSRPKACYALNPESGTTDNLANITQTNTPDGTLLVIRTASSANRIVVKHAAGGAGQISLATGADTVLGDTRFFLYLRRDGALWTEIARFVGTNEGHNYGFNTDMEIWGAGASAAPTGWTLTGAAATVARDGTNKKLGSYGAAITRAGTDCYLYQRPDTFSGYGPVAWWQGKVVTFGCWVRATVASRARLAINDGVGTSLSGYHTGGSAFEWLAVTRTIAAAATVVEVRLQVDTGNTTAQFDGATLVTGFALFDALPAGWRGRKAIMQFGSATSVGASTTRYLGMGTDATETNVSVPVPFKGVARNLHLRSSASPGGADTFVYVLRTNEATDTSVTATVSEPNSTGSDVANEVEVAKAARLAVSISTSGTAAAASHRASVEFEEIP